MPNKKKKMTIARILKYFYLKLIRINDTPHKIAGGVGLGVFLGILPGVGLIAAFVLALILRVNRAAALIGCLITNTWLSVVGLVLSVKIGSWLMRLEWHQVYNNWKILIKDFHFSALKASTNIELIMAVVLGYLVVAGILAVLSYLVVMFFIIQKRKNKR